MSNFSFGNGGFQTCPRWSSTQRGKNLPSLQAIATVLRNGGQEPDSLLALTAFNLAIGNSDAHAKNISLLRPQDGSYSLAPAYDVAMEGMPGPTSVLSWLCREWGRQARTSCGMMAKSSEASCTRSSPARKIPSRCQLSRMTSELICMRSRSTGLMSKIPATLPVHSRILAPRSSTCWVHAFTCCARLSEWTRRMSTSLDASPSRRAALPKDRRAVAGPPKTG